ncbi:MAG: shikimate dehydrogenase [Oscillospiraceae bacterium]|nr:shikimate dehydrogenase [Oscillospiraceae bacterium]
MKYAGLLGYPLGHTLSPLLHGKLCRFMPEPMEYDKLEISMENLELSMPKLKALDGFNVTIPHKRNIQTYLDGFDASAQKHGAVNVVAKVDGKHIGYNTDCIGFVRCVEAAGIPLQGKVCVVGIGGAGRMFATECAYRGCQLTLAVRSQQVQELQAGTHKDLMELQQKLAAISGNEVAVVASETLNGDFDLLINASPVGMFPKVDAMPVNCEVLRSVKAVFDCIYNPKETRLMQEAKAAGCRVCGGMPMLVWQAAAAQEIWYGQRFTEEQVEQVLQEMEEVLL